MTVGLAQGWPWSRDSSSGRDRSFRRSSRGCRPSSYGGRVSAGPRAWTRRVYQAEGRVITQKPSVLDFWNRRLDFLAEQLDIARDEHGAILFDGARAKPMQIGGPASR
jgi:hypothetical protein